MSILEEVYTNPKDVQLNVVELKSKAWSEDIVLVSDFVDHEIITEDGRKLTAKASGLAVSLPKRDASGVQDLQFALEGVRSEATQLLRRSIDNEEEITLTYRVYLASDLSEPAALPYDFVIKRYVAQANHIQITAGLFNLIDTKFPRVVYNSDTAPCLKFQT